MKPSWALVLFVFTCTRGYNQAVTIATQPFTVRYYRLPDRPLDPSWTNYSLLAEPVMDDFQGGGISDREMIRQLIRLEGYAQVMTGGDIRLEVRSGPLTIPSETLKSRKSSTIDKDGREHLEHEFYYEVKYVLPLSCTIRGKGGEVVHEIKIYDLTDDLLYKTGYYKNDRELDAWWRTNKGSKMSELKNERLRDGLAQLQMKLNEAHGFTRKEEQARLETIGRKKHPHAGDYDQALRQVVAAFASMDADQGLSEIKQALDAPLRFYTETLKGLDAGDKEEARLRHICLLNLAVIHFWLEDFDQASAFAVQLITADNKDKEALKLLEEIKTVKMALEKAGRSSRHGAR